MPSPIAVGQYTFDLVVGWYAQRVDVSELEATFFLAQLAEVDWSTFYGLILLAECEQRQERVQ